MAFQIFKQSDNHEFKPILSEIEESPCSPLGRIIFWLVISVVFFAILWMCIGKVDVVISARGQVIPEGEIKILQPLNPGALSKILVKKGNFVVKGQVLMEIDPSATQPELEAVQENLKYLQFEIQRLESLSKGKSFNLSLEPQTTNSDFVQIQKDIYKSIVNALQNQLLAKEIEIRKIDYQIRATMRERERYDALLKIVLEKEKRLKTVLDIIAQDEYDKVVSEILGYQNRIGELESKLEELNVSRRQVYAEIGVIKENFRANILKELATGQKQSTELKAKVEVISFTNEKEKVVSPVAGYVHELFIHTIGGVVVPAQKLISIVPINLPLVIKSTVLNKDIGFVKEGMNASIKIDAFDFQKYGMLKGNVRQVSKDSIEDEKLGPVYEIYIQPIDKYLIVEGKKRLIFPGMSLTSEIKVGKRRIIEFFIYPLIKYLDEGMGVR